jgi:hypothetical protein
LGFLTGAPPATRTAARLKPTSLAGAMFRTDPFIRSSPQPRIMASSVVIRLRIAGPRLTDTG